ncbi:MAG: hypothetical protein KJ621_02220 [Proteobacteria bacterium]|nr:hypothetical protein [Pseudomonadota bacterium]MBU1742252.1 hypothetical protein [Pseudomonadota bacterium]
MKSAAVGRRFRLAAMVLVLCLLPGLGLSQAPAPQKRSSVRIRVAWPLYYYTIGKKSGGMSKRMIVRVEPSDAGDVRVGFFESEFMASGSQWRAAGWMAAVVSALITGQPMSKWRISYDVAGRIDGPSAGGLMTATVLAAVLGRHVLPKVTMTGTINPDGTIGPVGGIYHKLHGAKKVGMNKVLIPAGIRQEKLKNGQVVDLYQRAKQLGLVLVEVADVYEAYAHLTGQPLALVKDDGRPLVLPARAKKAVTAAYNRWSRVLEDRLKRMSRTARDVPAAVKGNMAKLWRAAHLYKSKADQAFRAGRLMTATNHVVAAAVAADLGAHLSYLFIALKKQGAPGLKRVFARYVPTAAFMNSFLKRLTSARVKNVNDLITVSEAFGYYSVALGVQLFLKAKIGALDRITDLRKLLPLIVQATNLAVLARTIFFITDDVLNLGLGYPGPPLPPMIKMGLWARAMRRASEANLLYIDNAIIDPIAREFKKTPDFVKGRLLGNDNHFQLAWLSFKAWPLLARHVSSNVHQAAAILGGTTTSWSFSALVIAKYYSLIVKKDKTGAAVGVGRPKLLAHMLRSAHRQLRRVILRAQAKGWTPIVPLLHLRAAEVMSGPRHGITDRINALSDYWLGSTFGRLFLILGGMS